VQSADERPHEQGERHQQGRCHEGVVGRPRPELPVRVESHDGQYRRPAWPLTLASSNRSRWNAPTGWSRSRCGDPRRRTPPTPRCGTNCSPSSARSPRTRPTERSCSPEPAATSVRAPTCGRGRQADGPPRHQLSAMRHITDVCLALHRIPQPTVAKVRGVAVGAGLNLALSCDLIVASENARLSEIFAKRGLSLDFGGSWLLPRLVGMHRAKELALLAEIIDAQQAAEMGLVNRVLPDDELDAFVDDWAARLAGGPPIALAMSKRLLNNSMHVTLERPSTTRASPRPSTSAPRTPSRRSRPSSRSATPSSRVAEPPVPDSIPLKWRFGRAALSLSATAAGFSRFGRLAVGEGWWSVAAEFGPGGAR
jgi:hypothetical protein